MNTEYMNDIPLDLAISAHNGTSFVPEKRGESERTSYAQALSDAYEGLLKHATTEEKKAILDREFAELREGYRRRYRAYLASQSRCVSSMIAGPSKFPVRQMEKRNMVVDRRRSELLDYLPRAKDAILKKLHPEWRPIMAGDGDAVERLREKIEQAEARQELMRQANAAIRKHRKAGAEAQVAALQALGIGTARAYELLKPDFCGRIGFADYELTNNNANIRRMQGRLQEISRNQAQEDTEIRGEHAKLEDSPADNRVRLFFPGKPAPKVISDLKSRGFRWTPSLGCWQAYRNSVTVSAARDFAGIPAGC